jgi:hypothetical protein
MHFWMGGLRDPGRLEAFLHARGIDLAGVSLVLDWNPVGEADHERRKADATMDLPARFPPPPPSVWFNQAQLD